MAQDCGLVTMASSILSIQNVKKSFGGLDVLKGINLEIEQGKITGIIGPNGAGKSTLFDIISGYQKANEGKIIFEGKEVDLNSPRKSAEIGIDVVYQDLSLCDNLDIVHNMFLGREEVNRGVLDEGLMESKAANTLTSLSVKTVKSVRQKVARLSGGQRQTVAIARAVLWNNKVVILDEPTAALGVAQTEQVLNLVRKLADSGKAVIIISHNLQDIFAVADRIFVLYLGKMAASLKTSETNQSEIVGYITGAKVSQESD